MDKQIFIKQFLPLIEKQLVEKLCDKETHIGVLTFRAFEIINQFLRHLVDARLETTEGE